MKHMIYNELRQHVISFRSISLYVILLLICLSNIMFSIKNKKDEKILIETFRIQTDQELDRYRESVRNAVLGDYKLLRKNNNLSFIISDGYYLPNLIEFNFFRTKKIDSFKKNSHFFNDIINFDWVFIVGIVLSFFALVFTFDSINKDKSKGLLKLNFANSVSRLSFLFAKAISRFILVFLPFIISFSITVIILYVSGYFYFTAQDFVKIILYVFASAVYVSVFLLAGIFFSIKIIDPAKSILYLLSIWFIFVIIIPSLGKTKLTSKSSELNKNIYEENLRLQLVDYQNQIINSQNDNFEKRVEIINNRSDFQNRHFLQYFDQIFSQINKTKNILCISPYYAFKYFLEKVTDTGIENFITFYENSKRYKANLKQFLENIDKTDPDSRHIFSEEKNFISVSRNKIEEPFPDFQQKHYVVLQSIAMEIIVIFIYLAIGLIITFNGFFEMDIT